MIIAAVVLLAVAGVPLPAFATGSPPAIASFKATPAAIVPGQSSTLSWTVTGATSLVLNSGVGAVTGTTVQVKPSVTTSYTLTATNSSGSVTATALVAVGNPPTIASFKATPAAVPTGQSSTLSWTVTGSPSLVISPTVGAVTGTSVAVKPSATTSYTLTATNTFGSATSAVSVMVGSPPAITSFKATPAMVAPGQSSTLSWTVTGSPGLVINPGVGAVTGTSVTVKPSATTSYTLTATNSFGSVAVAVSVTVGSPPTITSFKATPATTARGQTVTLSWTATGSPGLMLNPVVGPVSGTSVQVSPSATTSYTLTATNSFGSVTATASVMVGSPPTISGFRAAPAAVSPGQSTTLNWTVTGSPSLTLNPGIGPVTGTSDQVTPTATTSYTLTASNSFGTATATTTATLLPANPPSISAFVAIPASAGPGVGATLRWSTTGATSMSIDHGVGTVTGSSVTVYPTAPTAYTLTATNGAGSVTATVQIAYVPLVTLSPQLYYTEHALFIVPTASQVTWTGSNSWGSVFSTDNVNSYVSTLKNAFPDDYSFVVVAANNLTPNSVPSVVPYRRTADGIGLGSTGVGVPSICRYNIGGGTVIDGAFGALDHEIGHNWGIFLQPWLSDSNGHWFSNSTVLGQMAVTYSDDNYSTDKQISGDPVKGFTWAAIDNLVKNETDTFADQDLYLQGLAPTFPDTYVLTSPVYKPDHTVTYSSVAKYDQTWMTKTYGARNPTYKTGVKRLRVGFVYIARDLSEVQAAFQPIERSINHFANAELIDTTTYRFQVPFLVDTKYRASVNALLADLDGNHTPTLTIPGPTALTSTDGTAAVLFTAADGNGAAPTVSCVPASANCSIVGTRVALTGLASGTHFFTIKAQDSGGKKTFAHFVVDVQ